MTAMRSSVRARFVGEHIIPHRLEYAGTVLGGISGLDYDPASGQWVFLSDDRDRPRFYTATMDLTTPSGIDDVRLTGVHFLRGPDGKPYPPYSPVDGGVDPEDLRVDPWTGLYWWCQEGDRPQHPVDVLRYTQPSIQMCTSEGTYVGSLPLPTSYRITDSAGPRRNLALEALAFSRDGEHVISAMESALLQDGPTSTPETGALSRITLHTRDGGIVAQYAYRQDRLVVGTAGAERAVHGISAVLAHPDDSDLILCLERTFTGNSFRVRLYETGFAGATDVQHHVRLSGRDVEAMRKRLVLDMAALPLRQLDNLEGMAWGPRTADGSRTLLLVSDDGYHPEEVTQIVVLALE